MFVLMNLSFVLRLFMQHTHTPPFFPGLLAVFHRLKGENSLLLQGKQLLVSFVKPLFEERRRERAM